MKIIVSPSLLSCDFLHIQDEIMAFAGISDIWFHLDIMDGHFVPNLTFGHDIVKKISSITTEPLDAHFMVSNPKFFIESFSNINLSNFTFHLEAAESNIISLINLAKQKYPSVGISIKPKTPVTKLSEEILSLVDLVLIMSVEPGFGGQSFIQSTYQKLQFLQPKKKALNFSLQVDGGVSSQNAAALINAGVDNLVAGSYIFAGGSNYKEKINALRPA